MIQVMGNGERLAPANSNGRGREVVIGRAARDPFHVRGGRDLRVA